MNVLTSFLSLKYYNRNIISDVYCPLLMEQTAKKILENIEKHFMPFNSLWFYTGDNMKVSDTFREHSLIQKF